MSASGHSCWPPPGSSYWPLTPDEHLLEVGYDLRVTREMHRLVEIAIKGREVLESRDIGVRKLLARIAQVLADDAEAHGVDRRDLSHSKGSRLQSVLPFTPAPLATQRSCHDRPGWASSHSITLTRPNLRWCWAAGLSRRNGAPVTVKERSAGPRSCPASAGGPGAPGIVGAERPLRLPACPPCPP